MCGIAGVARKASAGGGVDAAMGSQVLAGISHRGPDASGSQVEGRLWLGHVRLSILDLSCAGDQPMSSSDGNLVIVYNGEVYNFRDLASEWSFGDLHSSSDTEVVLRAFAQMGTASFSRLNGMFAFGIYDKSSQKLWLVRDRLGIKPLYYRIDETGLSFGSEIKSILAMTETRGAPGLSSVREWLYYGNLLGGKTFYRGIQQLLPGCYLEMDLNTFNYQIREYWSLRQQVAGRRRVEISTSDIVAETRDLLEKAVRRQLVSDVPVGVFLSGGVDSSAITAFASRHYQERLATYSAGFDDLAGVDERPKAKLVAEHFSTDHHEMHISGGDLPDLIEKMVRHHDMPFSDAANIPLYLMAEQISRSTKVVLQGDGGDELFGGYRRYATLKYRPFLKLMAHMSRPFERLLPDSVLGRRVRRYRNAYAADDMAATMALLLTPIDPRSEPEAIFSPRVRRILSENDPFERYREVQPLFRDQDVGNQMSFVDLMVELPDIFLEKVDRATMAASLEVRVPFLDHDLVDYVVRIPDRLKMPWGKKKWLLKQALRGIVPDVVLFGPKTGFSVPFGHWLRTSLKPLFFDHLATFERGHPDVLSRSEIEQMYAALDRGQIDRANTLWNLLNLMIWCNQTGFDLFPVLDTVAKAPTSQYATAES